MTTGAPNTAVTVLMLNSTGENKVLAIRSQKLQNTAPPKKQAGIIITGFVVLNRLFTNWGTAIPTKDTGPAKAVTQAERILETRIRARRNAFMFTPMLAA